MAYREAGARFSIDRRYCYALWRVWDHDENLYNRLLRPGRLIAKELGKNGPGQFVVPGLLKLKVVCKPATKSRPGTNPFTGEPMTIRAKPARNIVRAHAAEGPQGDGLRRGAGWRHEGHRGIRQRVSSRLGGTADKVSKEGTPERIAASWPKIGEHVEGGRPCHCERRSD